MALLADLCCQAVDSQKDTLTKGAISVKFVCVICTAHRFGAEAAEIDRWLRKRKNKRNFSAVQLSKRRDSELAQTIDRCRIHLTFRLEILSSSMSF